MEHVMSVKRKVGDHIHLRYGSRCNLNYISLAQHHYVGGLVPITAIKQNGLIEVELPDGHLLEITGTDIDDR